MILPTAEEVIVAYLLAFSGERFCADCLATRTGVDIEETRRRIRALRSFPGARRRRRHRGRCARCNGRGDVIGLEHDLRGA